MKFRISAITSPFGEPVDNGKTTSNPEEAIKQWFVYSKKYPTCASICPETNTDGLELLKWAESNFGKIKTWAEKYRCPYKLNWLQEQITKQITKGDKLIQWEFDEIYPFSMG